MRRYNSTETILVEKLKQLPGGILTVTFALFLIGVIVLFSAAKGNFSPWAIRQIGNALFALPIMIFIMLTDIRYWFRISYKMFAVGILLLLAVKLFGVIGGLGAQRWLKLGPVQFQPSELMKVFLVLALARFYHLLHFNNLHRLTSLFVPIGLTGLSAGLVLIQPNLGTAAILCMVSGLMMFATGISWKKIIFVLVAVALALPILWNNMHDYQKRRVHTFLSPEDDALGSGYNIIQSKIAVGSGGIFGKGFLNGSQTQLNFVPEQQTDFIFSILAEEFGFVGSMLAIGLFATLMLLSRRISESCTNVYARCVALGMSYIFFVHVFVNVGMVIGVLPVVGVPLPLISYGGSSLISSLIAVSFIVNAHIHRNVHVYINEEDERVLKGY
jgi:rod shape determining protein RodA